MTDFKRPSFPLWPEDQPRGAYHHGAEFGAGLALWDATHGLLVEVWCRVRMAVVERPSSRALTLAVTDLEVALGIVEAMRWSPMLTRAADVDVAALRAWLTAARDFQKGRLAELNAQEMTDPRPLNATGA